MGFSIIYKNLFEIKLIHHFFLDKGETSWDTLDPDQKAKIEDKFNARDILEIIPTEDCRRTMDAHKCLFKATPTGILAGIKAGPDDILPGVFNPFIKPGNDVVFRFQVRLKDMNFMNYTALPLQSSEASMYIFKNYSADRPVQYPSLSSIPPVYESGETYFPGDMLSDNAASQTKLFTALLKTSAATSIGTDWMTEAGNVTTPLGYANVNDRFPVVRGIMNYRVKTADVLPGATFKNSAGEIMSPLIEVLPGDFKIMQADLRNFPQGFYTLHLENDSPAYTDDLTFYLMKEDEVPFGLIEIRVKSDTVGYDLLDQGRLLSPIFELRFRNRRTHWRYSGKIFNTPYVIDDPLPLTRNGHIEITKPPKPGDSKIIMLPNPSDPVIKPEALIKTDENKYYSDIHIN